MLPDNSEYGQIKAEIRDKYVAHQKMLKVKEAENIRRKEEIEKQRMEEKNAKD